MTDHAKSLRPTDTSPAGQAEAARLLFVQAQRATGAKRAELMAEAGVAATLAHTEALLLHRARMGDHSEALDRHSRSLGDR